MNKNNDISDRNIFIIKICFISLEHQNALVVIEKFDLLLSITIIVVQITEIFINETRRVGSLSIISELLRNIFLKNLLRLCQRPANVENLTIFK